MFKIVLQWQQLNFSLEVRPNNQIFMFGYQSTATTFIKENPVTLSTQKIGVRPKGNQF
jgi:hypothetical protein